MVYEELQEQFIFINLEAEKDTDVFAAVGGTLAAKGYAKESYVKALGDREKEYPTGLDIDGFGAAIPHTDISHTNKTAIAVATLKHPVTFHQMGGDENDTVDVSVVFMLCVNDPHGYISQLQRVINIIQDKSVLEQLKQAETKQEIIAAIKAKEEALDAAERS